LRAAQRTAQIGMGFFVALAVLALSYPFIGVQRAAVVAGIVLVLLYWASAGIAATLQAPTFSISAGSRTQRNPNRVANLRT
jgi:hypothetical protein